jgi:hypothetical protein
LNIGLEPLFIQITPKDAIEGFNNELLIEMSGKSLFALGSLTLDPYISIDTPKYAQKNDAASVILNTGSSSYESTG